MRLIQVYNRDENVVNAAQRRVRFIFDNFDDIKISVSGGADSSAMAHLMLSEAKERNRKIGIFFLDEEVMYQSCIDQVTRIIEEWSPDNVIPLWLQAEFNLTNATSYSESHLIAWEPGKHKLWMRPKVSYAMKFHPWDRSKEIILDKRIGLDFYAMIANFEACYSGAAFVVGLRGTESPNRWRSVSKNPADVNGQPVYWGTTKGANTAMYPIYDWNQSDVWKYTYDHKLPYSPVYDYMFRKGMGLNEIRTSSLIHERSHKSLVELPEFEPKTYNKLLKRIKGISFAQETGKNSQMFRARKLPKQFKSWRKYRDFLLKTYPEPEKKDIFLQRFARHLDNEYVARQQVRQLVLCDIENNVPVENKEDPRQEWIRYYMEVL